MRCPACSHENPPGSSVCESCGTRIVLLRQASASREHDKVTDEAAHADTAVKAGGQLPAEQPPGEVIAGRFEIQAELGRGGTGLVYRAHDRVLRMDVALKLLQAGLTKDPTSVERLKREIIAARRVTHRNVIRINEFGFDEKEAFVAMEYLTGGSLTDVIDEGPIDIGRGVKIAIGICEGLAAAHAVGVIHRDMKPDNVLFDAAGVPKLVDFGLARLSETSGLTVGFSGTPFYMSPEQGEGREITPASDVYSTGVLLFQMFTNSLPFEGDSLVRIAVLHAKQEPPRPRLRRTDLPEVLERLILDMLAKDAAARPSAAEVVDRLVDISAFLGDSVSLNRLAGARLAPVAPASTPPVPAAESAARRRPIARLVLALLLVPALVAIPFVTGLVGGSPDPTPTATPLAIESLPAETPATPTPAAITSPLETPATPVPQESRVALAPSPTPVSTIRTVVTAVPTVATPTPVITGALSVLAFPSVEVWVDGKRISDRTPLKSAAIPVGKRTVTVKNPSLQYEDQLVVNITAGAETKIRVDAHAGSMKLESM